MASDVVHSAPTFFFILLLLLPLGVTWVNDILCRRHFPEHFGMFRFVFWLFSLSSTGLLLYSRLFRSVGSEWSETFHFFVNLSYVWAIGQIFLLLLLILSFLMSFLIGKCQRLLSSPSSEAKTGLSRRNFFKITAGALPVVAFGLSAEGVYQESQELTLARYNVPFPNLPESLHHFKIAQISDAHLGPFFMLDKLDEAFGLVRQEKPQLLVITGDLIDDLGYLEKMMIKLEALSEFIPYGIYFCWGNHEYFRNKPRIAAAFKDSAVTLLDNSSQLLFSGKRPVYLLGVDYPWSKNKGEQQQVIQAALARARENVPKEAFSILLAHHPDFLTEAFQARIPLTLSGHTHGGQVALFGHSLLPVQYKYMRGMYQEQGCYGYVSTGAGQWLPFRLGCPAEVVFFTLLPA
ncbi:putative MPP superfamily phosphohydrolase [Sporomusaceae bacterium BoRhaA]|uniref:metallophosphoesterase n=1 Tax=Pelorhabdus rhamnosifermentans TaxID=2772457 RepID=UPI001C061132|nr:metallophosphoesterase [Pelorhabdus rhamnosifermentans]MBU2700820.1 putative MPP superfamily phosphohydrolase [Pelorhabdus rhamnosifermentans]